MDEIRRQDLRLFAQEAVSPMRLIPVIVIFGILATSFRDNWTVLVTLVPATLAITLVTAWNQSVKKRFRQRRFEALWNGCVDRLTRFEEVLKRARREQIADMDEVPKTIRQVAHALYTALRRADMVSHEVQQSEKGLYSEPPVWVTRTNDPQSNELYRVADKNIAEYRAQFSGVMAGVQRTEAQSAVFMTTLDTLRMKMLGYRLVGRRPELPSDEFLTALAEAKTQLAAIDTALEELDLGHYPKTIAVVPGVQAAAEEPEERVQPEG